MPSRDQYFPLRQNLSSDELVSLKTEEGPHILSKYNKRTLKLWTPTVLFATLSFLLALSNIITVYQLSQARNHNEHLKSSYSTWNCFHCVRKRLIIISWAGSDKGLYAASIHFIPVYLTQSHWSQCCMAGHTAWAWGSRCQARLGCPAPAPHNHGLTVGSKYECLRDWGLPRTSLHRTCCNLSSVTVGIITNNLCL